MWVFAAIFLFVPVYLAVSLLSDWLQPAETAPTTWLVVMAALRILLSAAIVWWLWRGMGSRSRQILTSAACLGVILGAIAFCGGFFGPMIFTPGANQGPLLGIFITGPLGFIGGGIIGAVYGFSRRATDPGKSLN